MHLATRLAGWLLRAGGIAMAMGAVVTWSAGSPWWAALLAVGGLGLVVVGALVSPGPGTGAHLARDMMELYDDIRYVRPPGGNLTDPVEGDEGRFTGR